MPGKMLLPRPLVSFLCLAQGASPVVPAIEVARGSERIAEARLAQGTAALENHGDLEAQRRRQENLRLTADAALRCAAEQVAVSKTYVAFTEAEKAQARRHDDGVIGAAIRDLTL